MDLLKTILVYLSLVFATSVQNAPDPADFLPPEPTPTPYVEVTPTPTPTLKPSPVPTINITPNPAYKTVKVGDNGDQVRELQEKLALYGYYTGEIDGRFGNQTRRAVEAFQYQHGLSSDGIAGRNTLTVLYESNEVRPAPGAETTPAARETIVAAVSEPPAETPVFTPEPTFTSTPEPVPTEVPSPEATKEPVPSSAETLAFLPVEGSSLRVSGSEKAVCAAAENDTKGEILMAYTYGDALYLPLIDLLKAAGVNTLFSGDVERDEYAFAMGNDVYRIAYTEDQAGEPTGLEAFKNNEPQILPGRDIRRAQNTLYLPLQSLESLLHMTAEADAETGIITIAFPELVQE